MKFTNEQLVSYSKPLSDTEETKCKNAITMISKLLQNKGYKETEGIQVAIPNTYAYETRLRKNGREIKILVQGSHANKTNVKNDSDVDIAIIQENVFNSKYRPVVTNSSYGFVNSEYIAQQYKKDIYDDLVSNFGSEQVNWNNKCLSVNGNSYRVDVDVVPARRYRNYSNDYLYDAKNYIGGIYIVPDEGPVIINYPEQHILNGKIKNNETNKYYKKNVRIVKKLRYLMKEQYWESADSVSSYMLESLLWNLPNGLFIQDESYQERLSNLINYVVNHPDSLGDYKEVNGIKNLCANTPDKNNLIRFVKDLVTFFHGGNLEDENEK